MGEPIDSKDLAILAELERNARVPTSLISRRLSLPRQTVQSRIDRMVKLGVIRKFIARVNNYILGDRTVELLLKLSEGSDRKAIAKGIASMPRIHCAFAMHGEWDIYAAVAFSNGEELKHILSGIYERFGKSIRQKGTVDAMSLYPFRSKLRLPHDRRGDILDDALSASHEDDGRTTITLTSKENSAIDALRENSRLSAVELADRIGTTPDTAARMVKSLLARKIVAAYTIQYDPVSLGYERYMCFISSGAATAEQSKSLLNYSVRCENIAYLIHGIGAYDYIVDIRAKGQQELHDVLGGIATALKGGIVRQDVMFVEDVWYGERILGAEQGSEMIIPEPAERQRTRNKAAYPAANLMEYLEKIELHQKDY